MEVQLNNSKKIKIYRSWENKKTSGTRKDALLIILKKMKNYKENNKK